MCIRDRVFVADSDPRREDANLVSREDLEDVLSRRGRSLAELPHVYQWNKRDLPRTLPISVMERVLNPEGAPSMEAIASKGVGVWETQARIVRDVMLDLRERSRSPRKKHA